MEKEDDHLQPSCNNQRTDINLSLYEEGHDSNDSTNLTQGPNSLESSSSKNPTFLTEELILGLGTYPIESSSKNSTTHDDFEFPFDTIELDPEIWRMDSIEKEMEFDLAVIHAKKRERIQEQFADYDQDNLNLNSAKIAAVFFSIGSWKWVSKRREDLVAKIYYKRRKLIWEFLIGTLKKKIEILWSNISAIKTLVTKDGKFVLIIELHNQPQFFQDIRNEANKRIRWGPSDDFTDNQASVYRQHTIVFEPGVLDGPFDNLLRYDSRLRECSQDPFPRHNSTSF